MDIKDRIKSELTLEDVFSILEDFGGEPVRQGDRITSTTICHNLPREGSRKLYYYNNDGKGLFHCYTGCAEPSFDIFELVRKVFKIQQKIDLPLPQAIDFIANRISMAAWSFSEVKTTEEETLDRWLKNKEHEPLSFINLPTFDKDILENFSSPRILNWEKEGISQEATRQRHIKYYAADEQIVIPHYDINDNLIGIRGRCTNKEMAQKFGKYRPIQINGVLYNHPLGRNLYNLNWSKENIRGGGMAIVFEAEKSCMMYSTIFGQENDISCAVCGSAFTAYQMFLLRSLGVKEIVFAFDRQFQEIGDVEFLRLKNKILKIQQRFGNYAALSFIFDKGMITEYKDSPIDRGKEKFCELFSKRIFI